MYVIGIDPGSVSGGIAIIELGRDHHSSEFERVSVEAHSMPSTDHDLWDIFKKIGDRDDRNAIAVGLIEKVHAMPGQGVSSTFSFGTNFGQVRMAMTAADVSWDLVRPTEWQRGLKIRTKSKKESRQEWKNYLKGIAQRKFPGQKVTLKTADALLIAEYLERSETGRLR